jgi:hypothetical protein
MTHLDIAKADVIYHETSFSGAYGILRDMQLVASATLGAVSEQDATSYPFYVSFSRSLTSYKPYDSVIFELDGAYLGRKYSLKPVQYWYTGGKHAKARAEGAELEERLGSKKGLIPLPPSVIRKCNIYVVDVFATSGREIFQAYLRSILRLCKQNKIPLQVYVREPKGKKYKLVSTRYVVDKLKQVKAGREVNLRTPRKSKYIAETLRLMTLPVTTPLNLTLRKRLDAFRYNLLFKDFAGLMAEIHNAKGSAQVREFVQEALKRKLKSAEAITEYIVNRWSAL